MPGLLAEVARFREWADAAFPGPRLGEWECDYGHWDDLYAAVLGHVDANPPESWSAEELRAVLYALARDNEGELLGEEIALRRPSAILALAAEAPAWGEPDARWQLAEQLGHLGRLGDEVERRLLVFASDDDEYVRRRALKGLAGVGSPAVERLALDAWRREDEHQEYARMVALDCLHRVGSAHLGPLLAEAERDGRRYLRDFAIRLRRGDVD